MTSASRVKQYIRLSLLCSRSHCQLNRINILQESELRGGGPSYDIKYRTPPSDAVNKKNEINKHTM